ncbi:MAG: hypothetical protein L3K26_12060 [Candidatus Hydrogenedentes bacterium]|nr:hypothetical protein [Candidatus Hydrogenedentota bacterium]
MKRKTKFWIVLIGIFWVLPALCIGSVVGYVYWYFKVPCTRYAPDYDETAFQAVKIGQPLSEVFASLGQPYRVVPPYIEYWEYDGWAVYFNEDGVVETQQLYQWDREQIVGFMGQLPPGVTVDRLEGKKRREMIASFGKGQVHANPWGTERLFFYTHPASGGMWGDRTWEKRMLLVDINTRQVTTKDSLWVIAGTPQEASEAR